METRTETAATTEGATVTQLPTTNQDPATDRPNPTRVNKPKKRTMDELENIAPNKMTEAEKIDCIKALREENNLLEQKAHAYMENGQKAYEQVRLTSRAFEDYKLKAQAKLNWAKQCVDHCRTAIHLSGNIED